MPGNDVSLTAEYVDKYTVTFDTVLPISTIKNAPADQSIPSGGKVTKPANPSDSKQNHTFLGWYKDSAYKTAFNFTSDTITEDTTLYAKWKHPYSEGICYYCWKADDTFDEDEDPKFTAKITSGTTATKNGVAYYGYSHSVTMNTYYAYVKDDVDVYVDDELVSSKNYTLASGSTVVTLRASFIKSLSTGNHTIEIDTLLGDDDGVFRISSSPKTGDESNVALYVTVGVLALAGAGGIAWYLLKKKK